MINTLIEEVCNCINDTRFKLEKKDHKDGFYVKASFYHDYFYVDKDTRVYSYTEFDNFKKVCHEFLCDIDKAVFYVFDCHALKSKLTKEFLNELAERNCNHGRN
jgi:hypothetical protein